MNTPSLMSALAAHCSEAAAPSQGGSAAVQRAKECVLDLVALAIGGSRTEVGRLALRSKLSRSFQVDSDSTGCSILGERARLSPSDAAGLNGLLGHALQCDDGMRRAHGHPGIAVIPAALASAEASAASGRRFLSGIIGGYEVFARVGAAINPEHLSQGFHPSGTVGAIAAAAAATLVLDDGAVKALENAMALAGSVSGGLMEYSHYGDMSSYFVGGNAARIGVDAAFLAREGMAGPLTILEGKYGMAAAMANGALRHAEIASPDPHGPKILQTYTKLFSSCRHTHGAIEAALSLRKAIHSVDEVETVRVEVYRIAADECDRPVVTSLPGAESSLQLTVAAALVHGDLSLAERSYTRYRDERVRALAQRVVVVHDPTLDEALPESRPARVLVTTPSEGTMKAEVDLPRGEPERPLSWGELTAKAWTACSDVLDRDQFVRLEDAVASLETATSLRQLADAATPCRQPGANEYH
ncbi:MmgE/PrpD family protein [Rhodococcus sp. NPDC059968]|uniref:MmgE/PrpD family protein n=1 Tax=Rhodococcus sp. NPDC059968 TaxID=3347017 RepID=UPI003672741B